MVEVREKTLGNFVVEEEIGRGGMGVVLRARQPSLDRPVVLKKLRRDLADSPELLERFQREARAAAAVHHQNVVAVYDCFSFRGDHYIGQEFVDGVDLSSALGVTGPLPWRIAALIALEVARGLEEIHTQGTVHRDLKPANVLLGRRGEVKIADFGIALESNGAALTQPGMAIGSPPYMPPEQMMGERMDGRGDLFSLGALLYEMLVGEPPYASPRKDDADSLHKRMTKERYVRVGRRARGTPRFLARLVRACLRGKPRQRIPSASAVRRLLERRLHSTSPSECRLELSSWLWEHRVFERRDNETVVLVAARSERRTRAQGWLWAALATAILMAGVFAVDAQRSAAPSPDDSRPPAYGLPLGF
ncbi:MAG: serine/threonine-protein kinase [Proteobacteria bacterium]|nr:serine/threonine-protein kinase [Pseudomonadota bacterium]